MWKCSILRGLLFSKACSLESAPPWPSGSWETCYMIQLDSGWKERNVSMDSYLKPPPLHRLHWLFQTPLGYTGKCPHSADGSQLMGMGIALYPCWGEPNQHKLVLMHERLCRESYTQIQLSKFANFLIVSSASVCDWAEGRGGREKERQKGEAWWVRKEGKGTEGGEIGKEREYLFEGRKETQKEALPSVGLG